ncbi:MAG TPA: cysteine synthase family protein [Thermoflexia bacterium]|jgi:cysteine synthase|nr:cysteine synthase family protein [Thermoflexia bacterium]
MNRHRDITGCIGNTPLVQLSRFYPPRQGVEVFAKLEYLNPGGSVKDRIALSMIDDAEARGVLQPGGTIIEPTAGNTGIALAMVATVRGYRCIFVVPERFSQEKQILMRALGAEIIHTPTKEGMEGAIEKAQELAAQIPGAVVMQQFSNPANVAAHYTTTGPEIWEQMEGRVDVVVLGAGTGGTFTGVVRYLKERNPDLYAVIVQPYGATLGRGYAGPHKIEGIGIDHIETVPILDESLIDRLVVVRDEEAHAALKELARVEGMLVGSSSGAAAFAARLIADEIADGLLDAGEGRVVTLFPDGSDRYLSKGIYGSFEEWVV